MRIARDSVLASFGLVTSTTFVGATAVGTINNLRRQRTS